jgi:hypothetical protein
MTLDDAMREPALKKQRTCTDYEMPSKEQELCLALNECRAALPDKTQLALLLHAKVMTLEARVAELEAIYEWQGG